MKVQYYICESCGKKAAIPDTEELGNCDKCGGEWLYAVADSKDGVKL